MKENKKNDDLTERALRSYPSLAAGNVQVRVFDTLPSTNTYAKQNAPTVCGEHTLTVARTQTAGRGRMGRSFFSPENSGVYFSIATLVPALPQALALTGAAAVAVRRAVAHLTGKRLGIKWVNDLFLQEKKVCGILCESISTSNGYCVVIGIGINLRRAVFPDELADIAGSLEEDALPRAALIAAVYDALLPYLNDPCDRSWIEEYRESSVVLGRRVRWKSGDAWQSGIARRIDDDGALSVQRDDGSVERLCTGEISLRLSENG